MPDPAAGPAAHSDTFQRDRALTRLADETFDVLVIGGGITGAGVALDAASRGLRTALVEKDDFASGTSSKSSKLIHGGLRYLQQNEYRLVYENLAERQRLLENAPHLVTPLPFLIPLFGKSGVVSKGVARVYRTALWLYDLTGGVRIGRRHEKVTREQAMAHMPTLRADRLAAGFLYWDARSDDSRLTLTVLRTAVLDHGAVAANHTRVTGLVTDGSGAVCGATVTPEGAEPFDIRASVVVNATGVWSDEVRTFDEHRNPDSIRPAKGIHITVPEDAFPCDIAAVIPVKEDKRSIFVVSWGDQVYLGTTDTAWDGPLDDPSCTPEDVDYILNAANAVSTRQLTRADITGIWSGLRPLSPPNRRAAPANAPPTCPAATPCGPRRADSSRSTVESSPPIARWPKTPSTPWSRVSGAGGCGAGRRTSGCTAHPPPAVSPPGPGAKAPTYAQTRLTRWHRGRRTSPGASAPRRVRSWPWPTAGPTCSSRLWPDSRTSGSRPCGPSSGRWRVRCLTCSTGAPRPRTEMPELPPTPPPQSPA